MASTSGREWDARAGVTDGTPARNRNMMSSNRPPAEPQFVAGGGVTPVAGLRLGAGFAHGVYRDTEAGLDSRRFHDAAASATVFNLEGEFAIGYTRVAGEWILDRFDTATALRSRAGSCSKPCARSRHAGTPPAADPRVDAGLQPPARACAGPAGTADGTVGYRLSPDITLKVGLPGIPHLHCHRLGPRRCDLLCIRQTVSRLGSMEILH